MTARKRNTRPSLYLLSGVIVISLSVSTFADRSTTIELTAEGKKICQHYREMLEQLSSDDQPVRLQPIGSGTALVQWSNGQWQGAADPRREGTALALPWLN